MNTSELSTVWAPRLLSVLRIVAALIFLEHGTQKLLGFPPSPNPAPAMLSLSWFAGAIEIVGGTLLALGLFTRPVAFVLSGGPPARCLSCSRARWLSPTGSGTPRRASIRS